MADLPTGLRTLADIARASARPGSVPPVGFGEGLRRTVPAASHELLRLAGEYR
jgi:hypothetical protein